MEIILLIDLNQVYDGKAIRDKRKKLGLSAEELADRLSVSVERLYKWEKGHKPSDPEEYMRVQNWLKMPLESVLENIKEPQPYYKKRLALKNNNLTAIPVYESEPVTLTNMESYRDQPPPDGPDFWITIPQLRDCNYGCRAKGDSMHPLIRTNALVIGKEILDLSVVVFGEVYIVKTRNGIETVKYIHPHEENGEMVLLVPYNQKAKTTPIHKSDILKLYEAKAVFNTL